MKIKVKPKNANSQTKNQPYLDAIFHSRVGQSQPLCSAPSRQSRNDLASAGGHAWQ